MPRRFYILANPKGGQGKLADILEYAKAVFHEEHIVCDVFYTEKNKNTTEMISETLDLNNHTDILVIGGDGTINAAANAFHDNFKLPLSFVPNGTGNDFVKNLQIGSGLTELMRTALLGELRYIDLGLCNNRVFVNGLGLGFDGEVVKEMVSKKGLASGHWAYMLTVLKILSSYKERDMAFSADAVNRKGKVFFMTIANGTTFGGGFVITPDAKLDDGLLDVCYIQKMRVWERFLNLPRLQNGSHTGLKQVEMLKVKKMEVFENEALFAHIDGELLGTPPFSIGILPQYLPVRVAAGS